MDGIKNVGPRNLGSHHMDPISDWTPGFKVSSQMSESVIWASGPDTKDGMPTASARLIFLDAKNSSQNNC